MYSPLVLKIRNHSFAIEMDEYWPSLGSTEGHDPLKHIGFWEHEWEQHGSGQPYEGLYYVQAAIRLRKSVNLLRILGNQGIFPDGRNYWKTAYVDAIKAIYGYPILKCYNGHLLKELIICVDGQARNFISCSKKEQGSSNCHKNIINFPPPK